MYKVTKWYAEDGTMFDDERDCYEYEQRNQFEKIKDDFLMLDANFDKIENPISDFESVAYIYVRTDHAAETLYNLLKDDWNTPWDCYTQKAGSWFYNEEIGDWMLVEELWQRLKGIKDHAPNWCQFPNYI